MNFIALLVQIIVRVIIVAPSLWLSGRALAGKDKAKFTDAIGIVALGTIIGVVIGAFVGDLVALLTLIVWLALIKHFFECGWLKALAIAIIAVIIFAIIGAILAIIGFGLALLL